MPLENLIFATDELSFLWVMTSYNRVFSGSTSFKDLMHTHSAYRSVNDLP